MAVPLPEGPRAYAGGGTLAAALARRGWIDSYVLDVNPWPSAGTPLFAAGQRQDLRLVAHTDYDDGVLQVRYDVMR